MKTREANYNQHVEMASQVVQSARDKLKMALEVSYPLHSLVRVVHNRGEYMGFVVGHDIHGVRVGIKNEMTDKISYRWFREVEMV